jgi:hypothetical protein
VQAARADAGLSMSRAHHLMQMRVNTGLLRWAAVTALFTAVAAAATMIALLVQSHTSAAVGHH